MSFWNLLTITGNSIIKMKKNFYITMHRVHMIIFRRHYKLHSLLTLCFEFILLMQTDYFKIIRANLHCTKLPNSLFLSSLSLLQAFLILYLFFKFSVQLMPPPTNSPTLRDRHVDEGRPRRLQAARAPRRHLLQEEQEECQAQRQAQARGGHFRLQERGNLILNIIGRHKSLLQQSF